MRPVITIKGMMTIIIGQNDGESDDDDDPCDDSNDGEDVGSGGAAASSGCVSILSLLLTNHCTWKTKYNRGR